MKTNKLFLFLGIILVVGLFIFGLYTYYTDYSLRCEKHLGKKLNACTQAVCKIQGLRLKVLKDDQMMSNYVKPGDNLIISVNLPHILQRKWLNVRTGAEITKPKDNKVVLCFVVYPVLMPDYMKKYDEKLFQEFYDNYQWEISPSSVLNQATRQENSVCTNLISWDDIPKMSLKLRVPPSKYLHLGYGDTKIYGLKILLVPDNLKSNFTIHTINKHYSEFIPLFLLKKSISFD